MSTKHTPGPWSVEARNYPIGDTGDYDGCWQILSANAKRPIVEIWEEGDEPDANALLIAAAPELLEALKLCYEYCRLYHSEVEQNNVGKAARAAIAKATGEQP